MWTNTTFLESFLWKKSQSIFKSYVQCLGKLSLAMTSIPLNKDVQKGKGGAQQSDGKDPKQCAMGGSPLSDHPPKDLLFFPIFVVF